MPSSTSSSEAAAPVRSTMSYTPGGLERSVPVIPWLRTLLVAVSATLILLVAWEIAMRHMGLRAGDLDDGNEYWVAERRKIDDGPRDPVVIIGDSRILFDTDLAKWQELTGRRPIQLALMGSNAQPVLHDLANDEHFAGLLVIGTAEFSYFNDGAGFAADALEYRRKESPSQRVGHQLYKFASRYLAFLDSNATLFKLIERRDWPERDGVWGPYKDVWKLGEVYDHRQTQLWRQLETDPYLRDHARRVWLNIYGGDVTSNATVDKVIATAKPDIERIRARGGDVVWVRPPSGGPILETERTRFPRGRTWDRLMRETGSLGVHFEDYAQMQGLAIPDWSHLSERSATVFTDAYVRELVGRADWFKRHGVAIAADTRPLVAGTADAHAGAHPFGRVKASTAPPVNGNSKRERDVSVNLGP